MKCSHQLLVSFLFLTFLFLCICRSLFPVHQCTFSVVHESTASQALRRLSACSRPCHAHGQRFAPFGCVGAVSIASSPRRARARRDRLCASPHKKCSLCGRAFSPTRALTPPPARTHNGLTRFAAVVVATGQVLLEAARTPILCRRLRVRGLPRSCSRRPGRWAGCSSRWSSKRHSEQATHRRTAQHTRSTAPRKTERRSWSSHSAYRRAPRAQGPLPRPIPSQPALRPALPSAIPAALAHHPPARRGQAGRLLPRAAPCPPLRRWHRPSQPAGQQ